VLDLGNYDIVAALRNHGCALCRVLSEAEVRAMDSLIDESGQLAETRNNFCDQGSFCREHAWLFHRRAALALTGVPVAKMYEALLRQDISRVERLELDLATNARNRRAPSRLLDRGVCEACERTHSRLETKAHGLIAALQEPEIQRAYRESDGLCVQHLDFAGAAALPSDTAVAAFLIGDLRRRLERLEQRLANYDRTRDYRFANERTDADADAWTDVVRSYVGDQFALTDD
jgi:Family of unknown function (DUF6062)